MSGGYRSELETAKRRIAELEDELALLPPVSKQGALWALAVLVFLGSVVGTGFLWRWAKRPVLTAQGSVRVGLPSTPPPLQLQIYRRIGLEPVVVPAGDTDRLVLPMWGKAMPDGDDQLLLVAFDGAFVPIWRAGPWVSQWGSEAVQLERADDLVVITDSRGGVHAVDAKTGSARGDFEMPRPISDLCITSDKRVRVGMGYVDKRLLTLAPPRIDADDPTVRCVSDARRGDCREKSYPCLDSMPARETPTMSGYTRWEEADFVLHLGMVKAPPATLRPNERPAPYAEARLRATDRKLWEGPLIAPGTGVRVGLDRTAYAHGLIAAVYPELGGKTHIAVRDAKAGTMRWQAIVPGNREDTRLHAFVASDSRLYLTTDASLFVYRLEDGALLRTLEWVHVP